MRKIRFGIVLVVLLLCCLLPNSVSNAKGTTFIELKDVYYTKDNCVVYAEPTYTSQVIVVGTGNLPVQVVGYYTNGWYKINIGVIAYCKMDSLTCTGELTTISDTDVMAKDAKKVADELNYSFHYLVMNKQKIIEKEIFNKYVSEKAIVYVKLNDYTGILFKMIYDDPVSQDLDLNYDIQEVVDSAGRTIFYKAPNEMGLTGQIANFQFRVGYDKIVDNNIKDMEDDTYNLMNTYYTEYSELSYAPVTQLSDFYIYEYETTRSLNDTIREKMADLRKGIKYMAYDQTDYRKSIHSKLRKDTEYIDYVL